MKYDLNCSMLSLHKTQYVLYCVPKNRSYGYNQSRSYIEMQLMHKVKYSQRQIDDHIKIFKIVVHCITPKTLNITSARNE